MNKRLDAAMATPPAQYVPLIPNPIMRKSTAKRAVTTRTARVE
jgi:hypothetical protein